MKIESPDAYMEIYQKSIENPENFWAEIASQFVWRKKWNQVVAWDFNKPRSKMVFGR